MELKQVNKCKVLADLAVLIVPFMELKLALTNRLSPV